MAKNYPNDLFKNRRFGRNIIIHCARRYATYRLITGIWSRSWSNAGCRFPTQPAYAGFSSFCPSSKLGFDNTRGWSVNRGGFTRCIYRFRESGCNYSALSTRPEKPSIFSSVRPATEALLKTFSQAVKALKDGGILPNTVLISFQPLSE